MAKMTDAELLGVLQTQQSRSIGYREGAQAEHRLAATRAYLGEPDSGKLKIISGRSQVVDTVFRDTIEGLLPDILKPFVVGDQFVTFSPVGKDDEQKAEQETDVVNQVLMRDNNGFLVLQEWFKSALMWRNSFVKYWWDDGKGDCVTETYTGVTEMGIQQLLIAEASGQLRILKKKEEPPQFVAEGVQAVPTYEVTLKMYVTGPGIRFHAVPPEEISFSPRMRSVWTTNYIEHRQRVTQADLIEEGLSRKLVESLPAAASSSMTQEESTRTRFGNTMPMLETSSDPSMREIERCEAYIRVDYDGDDEPELRKVCYVGQEIIENEPADFPPFAMLTPIIMPFSPVGLGMYDQTADLQDIGSILLRQTLDNFYFALNGRWEVPDSARGADTIADLLASRPGGVVRTSGPGLKALETPIFAHHAFSMIEHMKTVKEERTGRTRYNQGMDANTLNKTATGMAILNRNASARTEMVARNFAETGVKDLMIGIHRLMRQHGTEMRRKSYRIRGQWVDVDPTEWMHRSDVTVNVGIGTEDKDRMLMQLGAIGGYMEKLIGLQGGITGPFIYPNHIQKFMEDVSRNAGIKPSDRYVSDPMAPPPQMPQSLTQKPTPPEVLLKQEELKLKAQQLAQEHEREMLKITLQHKRDMRGMAGDQASNEADLTLRALDQANTINQPKPPGGIGNAAPQGASPQPTM